MTLLSISFLLVLVFSIIALRDASSGAHDVRFGPRWYYLKMGVCVSASIGLILTIRDPYEAVATAPFVGYTATYCMAYALAVRRVRASGKELDGDGPTRANGATV